MLYARVSCMHALMGGCMGLMQAWVSRPVCCRGGGGVLLVHCAHRRVPCAGAVRTVGTDCAGSPAPALPMIRNSDRAGAVLLTVGARDTPAAPHTALHTALHTACAAYAACTAYRRVV
jgi:hypothetical protein